MDSKQAYIERCEKVVAKELNTRTTLLEYVRNKRGHACGLVVAYRDSLMGQVLVGWSLCNIKLEKFNKNIGLCKAIDRALDLEYAEAYKVRSNERVPRSVEETYVRVLARAKAYFKDE